MNNCINLGKFRGNFVFFPKFRNFPMIFPSVGIKYFSILIAPTSQSSKTHLFWTQTESNFLIQFAKKHNNILEYILYLAPVN